MPGPTDGREHPPETVWDAQERYCVLRHSYAKIAGELDVAASTLKRWGAQYEWADKREEFAKAQAEIRFDTVMARSKLLKDLVLTGDPVVGFAVGKMEELALKQAEAAREGRALAAQAEPPRREINTQADAHAALKEAIEIKLGRMLASPEDLDLKAVKEIKKALDLLADMGTGDDTEAAGKRKGISKAALDEVQKLLGL